MKAIHSGFFILIMLLMSVVFNLQYRLLTPVRIDERSTVTKTYIQLKSVGITSIEIAKSIDMVSDKHGVSQEFLIALMYTESTGNKNAVSCKGYNGLMQIPQKVFYEDANILIGARIFKEKMELTNRNVESAIMLYKGYPLDSMRGKQQAQKVLGLYHKLKREEV